MKKRVTLQDIANELGISRNTVSRALNHTGKVSDDTLQKICETARQMGYRSFVDLPTEMNTELPKLHSVNIQDNSKNEIALLTQSFPGGSHSGTKLIEVFQQVLDSYGYKFSIHMIRQNEIDNLCMPNSFNYENTAGIFCVELFSQAYTDFICQQNYPTLFIDSCVRHRCEHLNADILYMENLSSSYKAVSLMIEKGAKSISFLGDYNHCQSFYERWQGYCSALIDHDMPINKNNCITADDSNPYADTNWLTNQLCKLDPFPDAFFCANDFLAIVTLKALKGLGKTVPTDVMLCGFDNSQEAILVEPTLSSIHIPSEEMGQLAANMLLQRIEDPSIPLRSLYLPTKLVLRDSL